MEKPAQDEIERLISEMKDDRRDVRSRAAYELGKHQDPRTLAPLVSALSDNDKFVRSWAAGALAKAGPPAIPPLLSALETPDPTVGYYAALALGELGDLRAVPLLAKALRDGDWDIRSSAASALAGLGDPSTLPDRILTEDSITGADRAKILASLGDVSYTDDQVQIHYSIPNVSEFCRQRSQSEDGTIRMGAVEALQALENAPRPDAGQREAGALEAADLPPEAPGPAQPVGSSQASVEPAKDAAAAAPAAQDTEKPKRSLWDRLTGR